MSKLLTSSLFNSINVSQSIVKLLSQSYTYFFRLRSCVEKFKFPVSFCILDLVMTLLSSVPLDLRTPFDPCIHSNLCFNYRIHHFDLLLNPWGLNTDFRSDPTIE